jgi:predicted DNA binding CopG/RHH family protein
MSKIDKDEEFLNKEFDFSKAVRNPYINRVRRTITINIDASTIDYFKEQSADSGIPYQTLINLYLSDCVKSNRKLNMSWS